MAATQHPSTKQDILQHLLKQNQSSAQDLADCLDISPQAVRRHLKDLESEGLIEHKTVQIGMGRPQHLYQLSREGHDRLPDQYDEFALSLLDTLTETVGQAQVSDLLRKQWERKAQEYREQVGSGSIQERVAHLVNLRRAEGYMTEWYPVPADEANAAPSSAPDSALGQPHHPSGAAPHAAPGAAVDENAAGDRFIITEYHCAISHIAESFPSVCGHELEMFEVALQDCSVERTHWLVNGEHRCGYLIQPK